jgi:hypothetical protein
MRPVFIKHYCSLTAVVPINYLLLSQPDRYQLIPDVPAGETESHTGGLGAEGATAPETLRQKDRWREDFPKSCRRMRPLAHRRSKRPVTARESLRSRDGRGAFYHAVEKGNPGRPWRLL